MAKSWERPWSIEEIVENAPNWSLAGDVALLNHLEDFSEKLFAKAENTNDNLNKLLDDLNESSIKLDLVKNQFLGLQNTQFIESRVYEDDETLETTKEEKVEKKEGENDTKEAMKRAVLEGLEILDKYYDKVSVPASDSEDEEAESYVLRMKDPYINRPLPYLIGSKEWHDKWHVGLLASSSEDEEEQVEEKYSDTDSESNLPITDRRTISTSDSGTDISNQVEKPVASSTFNDTLASTDSEEYNNSIPSKPPISNLSFAEQLASRLGNVAKEEDPVPVNRNPIHKPTLQSRIIGDILSDEPPPLDDPEDGLFSGKSGQGMFSGGDGLFDDSDDETDYFSGKKVPTNAKQHVVEGKVPNLFEDNEEEGMFAQKTQTKSVKSKTTNKGLFSDEESDDDLFSTSNYRPQPSYIRPTTNTIPFIPDEPPELITKTKNQDTLRNLQSAQSNNSEFSEKSSTSNTESGDLEADNRLLINAKQKPNKVGLFDDPTDLFKDDLFSNAGLFSTTNTQKDLTQKKKLKLFDDEDDDMFASPKHTFSGPSQENTKSKSQKENPTKTKGEMFSDSKSNIENIFDDEEGNNKNARDDKPIKNKNVEFGKSKLFGSDEDLFESNSLFNSTAQDNKKGSSGLFSSGGKLFDSPEADLFTDKKEGLFDSPAKTKLFDTLKSDEKLVSVQGETSDKSKSKKTNSNQESITSSSNPILAPVSDANLKDKSPKLEPNKANIFSSSQKIKDPMSSNPDDLFPSQSNMSSKESVDVFNRKENIFDEDDDGWDKPPLFESSKVSSTRNLFDEDSSDDDLFSSKPPLKKLLEKKAEQKNAKFDNVEGKKKTSQEGTTSDPKMARDQLENPVEHIKNTDEPYQSKDLTQEKSFKSLENQHDELLTEGKTEEVSQSKTLDVLKNDKLNLENSKVTLEKTKASGSKILQDQGSKKPIIASKKPEINKSTLLENKSTGANKKIQNEKPPIVANKPVLPKKIGEESTEAKEKQNIKNSEPEEPKETIPPFSLFNDSPPDIDWDTKSETNLFDDEDMFDDIPVSSQKVSIFDNEPPALDSFSKSKKTLFDEDDGAPSVKRVINLFDDGPPSLDFMVKSPRTNDIFQDSKGNDSFSSEKKSIFEESTSQSNRNFNDKLSGTVQDSVNKEVFKDEADFTSSSPIFDVNAQAGYRVEDKMGAQVPEEEIKKSKPLTEKHSIFEKKPDASPEHLPVKKKESPGKIKHNLNINVNALMPGASLPWKKDTSATLIKSRSLEEQQESAESEPVQRIPHTQSCKDVRGMQEQTEEINDGGIETLHSITKNRARIQTKRKPSTRRARQASIKKKHEEDNNNSNSTDDINKNALTDVILDNASFSTQNNNLDEPQTIKPNDNSDMPESNITPIKKPPQLQTSSPKEVINTSSNPVVTQTQNAKTVDASKNTSLFDEGDSDSDIFADRKQRFKEQSKLSLFGDVDDGEDLFSAGEVKKQERDNPSKDIFKDDVDIFAPRKVAGKKGSLFEDLSEDEDIFGSGTTVRKTIGKSSGTSEKRPARNRNLLRKSEERRVVDDPLDAMANNFND